jgi:3-oxoacyl-[acyl-carrier-protein] synthase II
MVKRRGPRRVVITGLGPVSPLGTGREKFWSRLLGGFCAAAEVRAFDTSGYRVHRGCEVTDFEFSAVVGRPPPPGMGRAAQFAIAATAIALADGRLAPDDVEPRRIGVSIGTTCGEIQILEARDVALLAGDGAAADAGWLSHHPACAIPASVGHWFGFAGPNVIIPTACAAGNFSIGYAMDLVRSGRADVMVAGGTDPFSRVAFTGFARLGSVAPRVCQPFDRNRRGILVGEGAGIVLVEALEHALARRAPIYAELVGYGLASDARHMTAPETDGIARAMALALRAADLDDADVDYVCAHGTGTPINDLVETKAIRRVLGPRAPAVPVSSIKSMLGHTMGAASALETIACALALRDGQLPPTINYETPDPACDLDYVPNRCRPQSLRIALNNALAFGGVNSCLALARWEARG